MISFYSFFKNNLNFYLTYIYISMEDYKKKYFKYKQKYIDLKNNVLVGGDNKILYLLNSYNDNNKLCFCHNNIIGGSFNNDILQYLNNNNISTKNKYIKKIKIVGGTIKYYGDWLPKDNKEKTSWEGKINDSKNDIKLKGNWNDIKWEDKNLYIGTWNYGNNNKLNVEWNGNYIDNENKQYIGNYVKIDDKYSPKTPFDFNSKEKNKNVLILGGLPSDIHKFNLGNAKNVIFINSNFTDNDLKNPLNILNTFESWDYSQLFKGSITDYYFFKYFYKKFKNYFDIIITDENYDNIDINIKTLMFLLQILKPDGHFYLNYESKGSSYDYSKFNDYLYKINSDDSSIVTEYNKYIAQWIKVIIPYYRKSENSYEGEYSEDMIIDGDNIFNDKFSITLKNEKYAYWKNNIQNNYYLDIHKKSYNFLIILKYEDKKNFNFENFYEKILKDVLKLDIRLPDKIIYFYETKENIENSDTEFYGNVFSEDFITTNFEIKYKFGYIFSLNNDLKMNINYLNINFYSSLLNQDGHYIVNCDVYKDDLRYTYNPYTIDAILSLCDIKTVFFLEPNEIAPLPIGFFNSIYSEDHYNIFIDKYKEYINCWIKRYDKELAEKTLKHTLFTINNKIKKEFYKKDFSIKFNIGNYKDYEKYLKLKVDKEDENKFLKKYFDIYKKI